MKDFCFIILALYFGYRLLMGLIVVYNWNDSNMVEARKLNDNPNINLYYTGLLENTVLLIISYALYAS